MDVLDFIHDLFSRDASIETALHLVMAEYGLTEDAARKKLDEYFEIIGEIDKDRAQGRD